MIGGFFKKSYALNLTLALVDLGLILFVALLLIKPALDGSKVLFELKKDLYSLEEERTNFDQLKKDYRTHQAQIEKVDALFIEREAPVNFIGFLEESSRDAGFTVKIGSASLFKSKSDVWPSTVFRLFGHGTSPSFQRFLEKIENGPYLMEISSLSLREAKVFSAGGGKNGSEIEMDADLKVFTK